MVTAGSVYCLAEMDFAQARWSVGEKLQVTLQVARAAKDIVRPGGTLCS